MPTRISLPAGESVMPTRLLPEVKRDHPRNRALTASDNRALHAVQLAALPLHAVADAQVVDALEVVALHAAVVEAHADAVDLVVAAVAPLDLVAHHAAGHRTDPGRRDAARAGADLVADHGAQHGPEHRTAARGAAGHRHHLD